jgi:MoxR-like ATPase
MGTSMTKISGTEIVERLNASASQVLFDKAAEFRMALICYFAGGHLLIEDIPGVGKTTFVKTLGRLLGLQFGRIQFTHDLLPSDILGVSIYQAATETFEYKPGPIFAELLLVDELNRASPRTQSALLQAMEEHQVTIDRHSLPLPEPFFVVATQNPRSQVGTFALPESQLDRFLMRIELGYPSASSETSLLMTANERPEASDLVSPYSREQLLAVRKEISTLHISREVAQYLQALLGESRRPTSKGVGLSPRAGLAWMAAARASAFLSGRDAVLPEDVQFVAQPVLNHRLTQGELSYSKSASLVEGLVSSVEIH